MPCKTITPAERDPICACSVYPYHLMSGLAELSNVIDAWGAVADLTSPVVADPEVDLHIVNRENLTALLQILATLGKWHLARYYAEQTQHKGGAI